MGDGAQVLTVLLGLVKVVGPFWLFVMIGGPLGAFVLVGWLNMRWLDKRDERKETQLAAVLEQHRDYMGAFNEKYDNNVALVEETQRIAKQVVKIAEELSSVVVLNTQIQTRLAEKIENNLFCPMVRAKGPQG